MDERTWKGVKTFKSSTGDKFRLRTKAIYDCFGEYDEELSCCLRCPIAKKCVAEKAKWCTIYERHGGHLLPVKHKKFK
jgi:hypothetical protein